MGFDAIYMERDISFIIFTSAFRVYGASGQANVLSQAQRRLRAALATGNTSPACPNKGPSLSAKGMLGGVHESKLIFNSIIGC